MKIRQEIISELNAYYRSIHINDFSSFIKSDFRDDTLFDLSEERAARNIHDSESMIEKILAWNSLDDITWEEHIELEICKDFCEYIIRNGEYYWYKFNLTHNTTPLPYVIKRLETYPINCSADFGKYMNLLGQFPEKLEGMIQKMRGQEERGIILPKAQVSICIKIIESLYQAESSLLNPFNRENVHIEISLEDSRRIAKAIEALNRALDKVLNYLTNEYNLDGVEAKPGLCNINGGLEYYKSQIITYTSYNIAPEELHRIGLEELEVTQSKMRRIISDLGFGMDIKTFENYLLENRICFDDTPAELQSRFDAVLARIKPRLGDFFLRSPNAACRCEALPRSKEGTTSWGYYSVPIGDDPEGVFYYSAAELDKRSQIRTAAIVAHELLPGHHFQTNLIAEDSSLPEISQQHFNTAYADGWAEYSADLANEMGIYNLYDLYGRYVWDMVLCSRLVVDTGLNAMGWSIEKASEFMKENTILTDSEIFTETLRYSVDMPAQALAYKFGSIKMHEFRKKAESTLGSKFDIKSYHEEILRYGSAPLNILEEIVDHYIEVHR